MFNQKAIGLIDNFYGFLHKIMKKSSFKDRFGTDTDISTSEIHILDIIGRREDASISEIASIYEVSKASISKTIDKLVKKGLVVKSLSPENQSRKMVRLTSKGVTAFDTHIEYHKAQHSRILDYLNGLSEEDIELINRFIDMSKEMFYEHI